VDTPEKVASQEIQHSFEEEKVSIEPPVAIEVSSELI
jgi:hypothetical protein